MGEEGFGGEGGGIWVRGRKMNAPSPPFTASSCMKAVCAFSFLVAALVPCANKRS